MGLSINIFTKQDSWYTGVYYEFEYPEKVNEVIFDEVVIPVQKSELENSMSLLERVKFIQISNQLASELTGIKDIDYNALLDKTILRYTKEAQRRENEAKEPFFADNKSKFLEWANENWAFVNRAKELKNKLTPFLVRGVYLNELTGGFIVRLKNYVLYVHHACLGTHAVEMKRKPLVIFLEKIPSDVQTSVSMGE